MRTFYQRFVECAERYPENVALELQRHDQIERHTYAEVRRMAESIGRWIVEQGLAPSLAPRSRLALLAENHPLWVAVYLGTIASGCVIVPLDTALHADQLIKLLRDSGASILFCDARHSEAAQQAASELKIGLVLMDPERLANPPINENFLTTLPGIFAGGTGNFQPSPAKGDDIVSLLYTSGTTADPKGVMLMQSNLEGEVDAVLDWIDLGPSDAFLGVLPMFHVLAQMANLLMPLVTGSRVVYLEALNTTEVLRALRERDITTFGVVPQFFNLIHQRIFEEVDKKGALVKRVFRVLLTLNRNLRRVGINGGRVLFGKVHTTLGAKMRYLVTGGSRFDPAIARDFHDLGIDVLQAYGLTETTAGVFANSPGRNVIGSVGKAFKGVEGRIVLDASLDASLDAERDERDGPPSGEVVLRGAPVMKGYWNRSDATAAVLREGWFYTGDLGYLDADGNLFLTGRKKEIIVLSNGKNVYPEEVEAHYLKSPYIKEMAVMGIEGKAGDGGRLHAVIVPDFEALRQKKIVNAKESIRFDIESLSQQIASTKRIGSYEIWQEDLPRTTTRKIKRFEVEKRVKAGQAHKLSEGSDLPQERPLNEADQAWLDQPEVQRALRALREAAPSAPAQLRPTHNLELDLGLDSMQRVEALSRLEQELGGNIEESQLAGIYSVRELVDAVLQSAASGDGAPKTRPAFAGWKAILAEDPDPKDVVALAHAQPISATIWYAVSRLAQMIAFDRFHLRVSGLEKLPESGAYILSSNHQSYLDPAILGAVVPPAAFNKLFAVGTSEIFGEGLMLRLARSLRIVVVDPDANLIPAMRAGAFGLRQGRPLILYPEGERSMDGAPRTFKKGAAILSIHLQVPIVPIAIDGFHDAWPRNGSFQGFKPLKMKFGDPILPPPESEASEEAYERLTAQLKAKVVEMWEGLRK